MIEWKKNSISCQLSLTSRVCWVSLSTINVNFINLLDSLENNKSIGTWRWISLVTLLYQGLYQSYLQFLFFPTFLYSCNKVIFNTNATCNVCCDNAWMICCILSPEIIFVFQPGNDPYCFVEFYDHCAASSALAAMNKRFCMGRVSILCSFCGWW